MSRGSGLGLTKSLTPRRRLLRPGESCSPRWTSTLRCLNFCDWEVSLSLRLPGRWEGRVPPPSNYQSRLTATARPLPRFATPPPRGQRRRIQRGGGCGFLEARRNQYRVCGRHGRRAIGRKAVAAGPPPLLGPGRGLDLGSSGRAGGGRPSDGRGASWRRPWWSRRGTCGACRRPTDVRRFSCRRRPPRSLPGGRTLVR